MSEFKIFPCDLVIGAKFKYTDYSYATFREEGCHVFRIISKLNNGKYHLHNDSSPYDHYFDDRMMLRDFIPCKDEDNYIGHAKTQLALAVMQGLSQEELKELLVRLEI